MVALPEKLGPNHAAANLKLFVETCKEGSTDLIKQYSQDGIVGKDPERSWKGFTMTAMSVELPKGRHFYFDTKACGAIAGYGENVSGDEWFKLSRRESYWENMPGASFMSFAVPTIGQSEQSGPLLSAALLPSGAVGFLSATRNGDNDDPVVKIAPWRNGTSWKQFVRDRGVARDEEMAHWAGILLLAMELGPRMEHSELEYTGDPERKHFTLYPAGGFVRVSTQAEGFAWDGQWKGRLN